jgi:hypothetical protein
MAVGLLAIGTRAHSQEPLRKIKIGVGTLVLNAALPYVMLPPALGYWQDEGYFRRKARSRPFSCWSPEMSISSR